VSVLLPLSNKNHPNFSSQKGTLVTMLFASVPTYFVFRSWAVVFLFAEFVILPIVVVLIYRQRVSKQVGAGLLAALFCFAFPIVFFLREMMANGAMEYWTTWSLMLFVLSLISSLCLLRKAYNKQANS